MNGNVLKEDLIIEIQELKKKKVISDGLVARLSEAIQEASLRGKELHAIMNCHHCFCMARQHCKMCPL